MDFLRRILGVGANASSEQIKSAYQKKARELHPDKIGGNGDEMKELTRAYKTYLAFKELEKNADDDDDDDVASEEKDDDDELDEQLLLADPEPIALSIGFRQQHKELVQKFGKKSLPFCQKWAYCFECRKFFVQIPQEIERHKKCPQPPSDQRFSSRIEFAGDIRHVDSRHLVSGFHLSGIDKIEAADASKETTTTTHFFMRNNSTTPEQRGFVEIELRFKLVKNEENQKEIHISFDGNFSRIILFIEGNDGEKTPVKHMEEYGRITLEDLLDTKNGYIRKDCPEHGENAFCCAFELELFSKTSNFVCEEKCVDKPDSSCGKDMQLESVPDLINNFMQAFLVDVHHAAHLLMELTKLLRMAAENATKINLDNEPSSAGMLVGKIAIVKTFKEILMSMPMFVLLSSEFFGKLMKIMEPEYMSALWPLLKSDDFHKKFSKALNAHILQLDTKITSFALLQQQLAQFDGRAEAELFVGQAAQDYADGRKQMKEVERNADQVPEEVRKDLKRALKAAKNRANLGRLLLRFEQFVHGPGDCGDEDNCDENEAPKPSVSSKITEFFTGGRNNNANVSQANVYREKAFRIMDWIQKMPGELNVLLQAALTLLMAAQLEICASRKMADEQVAGLLLLQIVQMARKRGTPDMELHFCVVALRALAHCTYGPMEDGKTSIFECLHKRMKWLTACIPVVQEPQSCSAVLFLMREQGETKSLKALRAYLHTCIEMLDKENRQKDAQKTDAYTRERIYYHAFEACLKKWWTPSRQSNADSIALTEHFRQLLMKQMLTNRGMKVTDICAHLNGPISLDALEPDGWKRADLIADWATPFADNKLPGYKALHGMEYNVDQCQIKLIVEEFDAKKDEPSERLFTDIDFIQIMRSGTMPEALLSLDQADFQMPMHPFQNIRFTPKHIYGRQLMHCMFICDYFLKWLTVGSEIQCKSGNDDAEIFKQRPIDKNLFDKLPEGIKDVIEQFRVTRKAADETAHRFWIAVEPIQVFVEEMKNKSTPEKIEGKRMTFGDVKMVIKKHLMTMDASGELIDADEKEGWPCYVLSSDHYQLLQEGKKHLPDKEAFLIVSDEHKTAAEKQNHKKIVAKKEALAYECVFWSGCRQNETDEKNKSALVLPSDMKSSGISRVLVNTITEPELFALIRNLLPFPRNAHQRVVVQLEGNRKIAVLLSAQENAALEAKEEQAAQAFNLVYKVTRACAQKIGTNHRYSAEFVLAYELTRRYDQLAMAIPEFGRLRELTKLMALSLLIGAEQKQANAMAKIMQFVTADTWQTNIQWDDEEEKKEAEAKRHELLAKIATNCNSQMAQWYREWRQTIPNDIWPNCSYFNYHSKLAEERREKREEIVSEFASLRQFAYEDFAVVFAEKNLPFFSFRRSTFNKSKYDNFLRALKEDCMGKIRADQMAEVRKVQGIFTEFDFGIEEKENEKLEKNMKGNLCLWVPSAFAQRQNDETLVTGHMVFGGVHLAARLRILQQQGGGGGRGGGQGGAAGGSCGSGGGPKLHSTEIGKIGVRYVEQYLRRWNERFNLGWTIHKEAVFWTPEGKRRVDLAVTRKINGILHTTIIEVKNWGGVYDAKQKEKDAYICATHENFDSRCIHVYK